MAERVVYNMATRARAPQYVSEAQYAPPAYGIQTSQAGRLYSSSTQSDIRRNPHVRSYDTIIAAGGVEVAYIAGTSFATAAFLSTRTNDISWALGTAIATFFVAGASREDAAIRDIAIGALASSTSVFTLRMMGKLKRFNGQQ